MTSSSTSITDSPAKNKSKSSSSLEEARGRFLINVASNIIYMVLNTIIMFWFTPFLVKNLGAGAYGMVPLANSIIAYMAIGTQGLEVSFRRFLMIDLNMPDGRSANRVFNTIFFIVTAITCIFLPLGLFIAWYFPNIFHVPVGLENQSRFVFACVAITFFLGFISSSFEVLPLTFHRFDMINVVRSVETISRVILTAILFSFFSAHLWHVGIGFLVSSVLSLTGYIYLWKRLAPQLSINISFFDREKVSPLFSMGIWSIINQIGTLLFQSTGIIVINFFINADVTGKYGALLFFPLFVGYLAETVNSVLNPAITARYAAKDIEGMRRLASQAVKMSGIALALPIGLMCGFAQPLLVIWLGASFKTFDIILTLMVIHLSINLATRPLSYVLTSYNKMKIPGIITIILGILNIGLSICFIKWAGMGIIGVALATAIMLTVRNVFIIANYSAYTMNLSWWSFYPSLFNGLLGTIIVSISGYSLTYIYRPASWLSLGSLAIAISLLYSLFAYFIILNKEDKRIIRNIYQKPLGAVIQFIKRQNNS